MAGAKRRGKERSGIAEWRREGRMKTGFCQEGEGSESAHAGSAECGGFF